MEAKTLVITSVLFVLLCFTLYGHLYGGYMNYISHDDNKASLRRAYGTSPNSHLETKPAIQINENPLEYHIVPDSENSEDLDWMSTPAHSKRGDHDSGYHASTRSSRKIVLLWRSRKRYMVSGNMGRFCPGYECFITYNESLFAKADAVVFNLYLGAVLPPAWRTPKQYYVFFSRESPLRRNYKLENYNHFFNLTMTYRLDADVPTLYGHVYRRKARLSATDWIHYTHQTRKLIKRKSKLLVWIVSHCHTDSRREKYIEDLRKYISIDVYGKCGNLTCVPKRSSKCYTLLKNKYKFILAFENSVCKDYITEKVFETMPLGIVPIVYGGAAYKERLPSHSYINVEAFTSAKELAQYLHKLDRDEVAYSRYFQWQTTYSMSIDPYEKRSAFCSLCQMLHDRPHLQKSYSSGDLRRHWGTDTCDVHYVDRVLGQL